MQRRSEMDSDKTERLSGKVTGLARESIPFTADELRAMLAVVEGSN